VALAAIIKPAGPTTVTLKWAGARRPGGEKGRRAEGIKQPVNIYQLSRGRDGPVNKIPGDAASQRSISTVDRAVRPPD
jgi:hypothetical protein